MTRVEFTSRMALLIQYANLTTRYSAILGSVWRSRAGQAWFFIKKLSRCDGKKKRSRHQTGKAGDLYLTDGRRLIWDRRIYRRLHKFWEGLGGRPMITWDIAHFE